MLAFTKANTEIKLVFKPSFQKLDPRISEVLAEKINATLDGIHSHYIVPLRLKLPLKFIDAKLTLDYFFEGHLLYFRYLVIDKKHLALLSHMLETAKKTFQEEKLDDFALFTQILLKVAIIYQSAADEFEMQIHMGKQQGVETRSEELFQMNYAACAIAYLNEWKNVLQNAAYQKAYYRWLQNKYQKTPFLFNDLFPTEEDFLKPWRDLIETKIPIVSERKMWALLYRFGSYQTFEEFSDSFEERSLVFEQPTLAKAIESTKSPLIKQWILERGLDYRELLKKFVSDSSVALPATPPESFVGEENEVDATKETSPFLSRSSPLTTVAQKGGAFTTEETAGFHQRTVYKK